MSSPSTSSAISAEQIAAAAERRTSALKQTTHLTELELHEKRQHFRRLIDPGILRPNAKEVALASLKTLLTIVENLLRDPDNPKYQRFRATNALIKRHLINPKGALEFAIALGFRPEVEDLEPYYVFNPRKLPDAHIGCAILKEAFLLETEKQERAERAKREEKAAKDAAAKNVKLAFYDDRKSRELVDRRMKEQREIRAAAPRGDGAVSPEPSSPKQMPGHGHVLIPAAPEEAPDTGQSLDADVTVGSPPPYHQDA